MPAPFRPALLLLVLFALPAGPLAHADEVTVYRCTGRDGRLTLRDTPCLPGETQQVRSMQRPQDPPPASTPPPQPIPPAPPQTVREVVIVRTPAQPMYECINAETGERYDSDSGEGNPRLVPLWSLGYPAQARVPVVEPGRGRIRVENGHVSGSYQSGSAGYTTVPTWAGMGGGTWVRDTCHMLPQQEVCARLSDRKYEILRRYNSALQSERHALDLEQRGIEARMANDCGN
ncbi:MAG: DUF4124 domain-containing protein [Pseudoxanthomonas sp.]